MRNEPSSESPAPGSPRVSRPIPMRKKKFSSLITVSALVSPSVLAATPVRFACRVPHTSPGKSSKQYFWRHLEI
jgi:hypothetical protein